MAGKINKMMEGALLFELKQVDDVSHCGQGKAGLEKIVYTATAERPACSAVTVCL